MAENPLNLPIYLLQCAKKGFFNERDRWGWISRSLYKLIYGDFVGTFDAGVNGAYWVQLEEERPKALWIVCPDNSLDFQELVQLDITEVFEEMAEYDTYYPVPQWDDLAEWISSKNTTLSFALDAIQSVTIGNLTTDNIPKWTDPKSDLSIVFRWIKQLAINAEEDNNQSLPCMDFWEPWVDRDQLVPGTSFVCRTDGENSQSVPLQGGGLLRSQLDSLVYQHIFVGTAPHTVTGGEWGDTPFLHVVPFATFSEGDPVMLAGTNPNKIILPISCDAGQFGTFSLDTTLQI